MGLTCVLTICEQIADEPRGYAPDDHIDTKTFYVGVPEEDHDKFDDLLQNAIAHTHGKSKWVEGYYIEGFEPMDCDKTIEQAMDTLRNALNWS